MAATSHSTTSGINHKANQKPAKIMNLWFEYKIALIKISINLHSRLKIRRRKKVQFWDKRPTHQN
jgi:hypothetical protein